jgi:hypothetical protein
VANANRFSLGGGFFVLLYYLPVYFQAVLGTSAEQSGIRNLALIITESKVLYVTLGEASLTSYHVAFATIAAGILVSTWGHFAPLMIIGSVLATVATGLIYTLSEASKAGEWIGYQILAGLGIGLCFQAPLMAGQALAKDEDVPTTTALLMFFQTLGGAITVSAAQAAFGNELVKSLLRNATAITPDQVVAAGATDFRKKFASENSLPIIHAYVDGLHVAFLFTVALFAVAFLVSMLAPWTNIKTGKQGEHGDGKVVHASNTVGD